MADVEEVTGNHEGSLNSAIATAVVRLVREYTGRGPTQARATVSAELVTVLMRDTLTKAERALARDGKGDFVLAIRHQFQGTMRADMIAAVEGLTERKVIAFMSGNHIDPDMATELFVLAPETRPAEADGRLESAESSLPT